MYSLLLVDDETLILDGLYNNIAWEDSGFTDVYKADDAQKALEILDRRRVDVVVTDISMPGLSGLELCERIRARWPLCRVVMLTGYREFEYACRAVELGVYQYLVKPVRYEDLQSIVEGALAEVQAELEQRRLLEQARSSLAGYGAMLRDRFLNGWLIRGGVRPSENAREMADAGVEVTPQMVGFGTLFVSEDEFFGAPVNQLGFQTLTERLLTGADRVYSLPLRRNEMLFVFLFQSGEAAEGFRARLAGALDVLADSARRSMDCRVSAFVSRIAAADELHAVTTALMDAARRSAAGPGAILLLDGETAPDPLRDSRLSDALAALDEEAVGRCVDEAVRAAGDGDRARRMLLTALMSVVSSDGVSRGYAFDDLDAFYNELRSPRRIAEDAEALRQSCRGALLRYVQRVRSQKDSQQRLLADEVRAYIAKTMAEGVTVNAVADHFHYNSNYLSHLVKQETGQPLEELLISMRMERACQLLKSGMRVQEAAMQVGYDNLAHFSRLFKRRMGMSPRQYVG